MFDENDLRDFLLKKGISKVGFARISCDDFSDYTYGISLLLSIPKDAIHSLNDEDYQSYWKAFHSRADYLAEIALECEGLIKDNGYEALALTLERNDFDVESLLTKLPYKSVATASGLGWIGRSALFVCEEYGSAVALSSVLTDMPLTAGSPVTDSFCDECEECQKACPVEAINPRKWNSRLSRSDIIDIEACRDYIIDQCRAGLGCSRCLGHCRLTQEYLKD